MTTYFFHIREGDLVLEDPDGSEHPDLAGAIAEAKLGARSLIAEKIKLGQAILPASIEITGQDGEVLWVVTFRDVLHELTAALR